MNFKKKMKTKLSLSEAIYGFCGWLTTRKEITEFGSTKDCANIAEKIDLFCKANNLTIPCERYHENLIFPE